MAEHEQAPEKRPTVTKVERGGEVDPDGPAKEAARAAAERGEGTAAPHTPGKAHDTRTDTQS